MKCDYYKSDHCDHEWMKAFSFQDADAYLFDRELFRLYEEAKRRGNGHPNILCRGTYSAGTACDNCERCRDEMRKVDDFNDRMKLRQRYGEARKHLVKPTSFVRV